ANRSAVASSCSTPGTPIGARSVSARIRAAPSAEPNPHQPNPNQGQTTFISRLREKIAPLRAEALARLFDEAAFGELVQAADAVAQERRGAARGIAVGRVSQRLLQR